jgi:hypothetical protein
MKKRKEKSKRERKRNALALYFCPTIITVYRRNEKN